VNLLRLILWHLQWQLLLHSRLRAEDQLPNRFSHQLQRDWISPMLNNILEESCKSLLVLCEAELVAILAEEKMNVLL
jgi:hypothetical protein